MKDFLTPILKCPEQLPEPLTSRVDELAAAWAGSATRPRVSSVIRSVWLSLLHAWAQEIELPIFVRRLSAGRGAVLRHESGRSLVPTDNSPANWSLSLALSGECPTLDQVRTSLEADAIPVAMALRVQERRLAQFRCTRAKGAQLNAFGWKVAHLHGIGLGYGVQLTTAPVEKLIEHFLRFMSPSNMFVVPLQWAGLAELPELVEAVSRADENAA